MIETTKCRFCNDEDDPADNSGRDGDCACEHCEASVCGVCLDSDELCPDCQEKKDQAFRDGDEWPDKNDSPLDFGDQPEEVMLDDIATLKGVHAAGTLTPEARRAAIAEYGPIFGDERPEEIPKPLKDW